MWTRNLREGQHWISGKIVDRQGPLLYIIRLPNRNMWRRHIEHLRQGACSSTELPEGTTSDESLLQCLLHLLWKYNQIQPLPCQISQLEIQVL